MNSEDFEEEMAGNDMMQDLAAAWEESENAEKEPEKVAEAPEKEPEPVEEPETEQEQPDIAAETPETEPETEVKAPDLAPLPVREAWKDTPEPVREAWLERERQHAIDIQKHAEQANFANSVMRAIAPYQAALQMEGNSPQEAFTNLGSVVHGLRNGTPQEKAMIVANLVNRYSVDFKQLDSALANGPALREPPPPQPQEFRDPRVDNMLQQQNAQQSMQANEEIRQFKAEGAEFLEDVRLEMADLMDAATARGQELTLQRAYDIACQLNPDVQSVLNDRKAKTLAAKREASSSVAGAPTGSRVSPDDDSIRAHLEYHFDHG